MDARCHAVVMTVENQKETKKKERDHGTVGGSQQTGRCKETGLWLGCVWETAETRPCYSLALRDGRGEGGSARGQGLRDWGLSLRASLATKRGLAAEKSQKKTALGRWQRTDALRCTLSARVWKYICLSITQIREIKITRYILAPLQIMSTYYKICIIHPITLVTT